MNNKYSQAIDRITEYVLPVDFKDVLVSDSLFVIRELLEKYEKLEEAYDQACKYISINIDSSCYQRSDEEIKVDTSRWKEIFLDD